jgi:SAM-dependent methyltransferase
LVDVTCNLCGADDPESVSGAGEAPYVRCRRCGLVYLKSRPAESELRELYAGYHQREGKNDGTWEALMRDVFREAADLLGRARPGAGRNRLLDVGCGYGDFVALMREGGWRAEGVDPSPVVTEAAARRGLAVRTGTLEEFEGAPASFDAVTMFYVLEHLADPMGALRKAYRLLSPGGVLLLRVPDTTPIARALRPAGIGARLYDPPFHLYDFAPGVLRKMVAKTGFVDVRTFPGRTTRPARRLPRALTLFFGAVARGGYAASGGRLLLPGVSKSTVAVKPAVGREAAG